MKNFPTVEEQMDIIKSRTIEVLPEEELIQKIENSVKNNKPMTIKLGCDPSRPDLHIGHAVVLRKLREFQDIGHNAVLIVGDFTAMIGDPSGKSKTRPQLTLEETRVNGETYLHQATQILSKERLQVRYNSEWLGKMSFREVIELAGKYTVAQLLERDDFSKRFKAGQPISVHELLYPLAQAMDSAAIESDVELGGTDQKFNLLVGREIQKAYGKRLQCIVTMPLLVGTDGVEKMSKSLDNYIAFNEHPNDMFGKTMSIQDDLIPVYYKYGAWVDDKKAMEMEEELKSGKVNPRDLKMKTAFAITEAYFGIEKAEEAKLNFENTVVKKEMPDQIDELLLDADSPNQKLTDILAAAKLVPSKKEAKRMIEQGAVSVDKEKIRDFRSTIDISEFRLLKVGKRKYLRVKAK